jgi:hypothetical protein
MYSKRFVGMVGEESEGKGERGIKARPKIIYIGQERTINCP